MELRQALEALGVDPKGRRGKYWTPSMARLNKAERKRARRKVRNVEQAVRSNPDRYARYISEETGEVTLVRVMEADEELERLLDAEEAYLGREPKTPILSFGGWLAPPVPTERGS